MAMASKEPLKKPEPPPMNGPVTPPRSGQEAAPTSAAELYGGQYMSAQTWDYGELTTKIIGIGADQMQSGSGGKAKFKIVLDLEGVRKPVPVNKTNGLVLMAAFGEEYPEWVGQSVKVHVGNVLFMGRWTPGIKIEPIVPNA